MNNYKSEGINSEVNKLIDIKKKTRKSIPSVSIVLSLLKQSVFLNVFVVKKRTRKKTNIKSVGATSVDTDLTAQVDQGLKCMPFRQQRLDSPPGSKCKLVQNVSKSVSQYLRKLLRNVK